MDCRIGGAAVAFQTPAGQVPDRANFEGRLIAWGTPGGDRRNIRVWTRSGGVRTTYELLTPGGRDFVFQMLRTANLLHVDFSRPGSAGAVHVFEVFGSDATVSQCANHVEDAPGGNAPPRVPGGGGIIPVI